MHQPGQAATYRDELEVQGEDILRHEGACYDGHIHPLRYTEGQVQQVQHDGWRRIVPACSMTEHASLAFC